MLGEDKGTLESTGPICTSCQIRVATRDRRVFDDKDQPFDEACFVKKYLKEYGTRPKLETRPDAPHILQVAKS